MRTIEDNAFLLLTIAISLAFAWILLPFYGAVLWGTVIAILFSPLHRRLLKSMRRRRNLAAFFTVMMIIAIVLLPMTLIAASLTQEALGFCGKVQSGELDLVRFFQQVHDVLPAWTINLLDRFDLASLGAVQQKPSAALRFFSCIEKLHDYPLLHTNQARTQHSIRLPPLALTAVQSQSHVDRFVDAHHGRPSAYCE